jgi:hypothetical protein
VYFSGGCSAYDAKNNLIIQQYAVNKSGDISLQFFAFDGQTGALKYQVQDQLGLSTMRFDPLTNLLYGIGFETINATAWRRTLVSLNGATGQFTKLANVEGYGISSSSISTIDPVSRRLFCILQKMNSGLSVSSLA